MSREHTAAARRAHGADTARRRDALGRWGCAVQRARGSSAAHSTPTAGLDTLAAAPRRGARCEGLDGVLLVRCAASLDGSALLCSAPLRAPLFAHTGSCLWSQLANVLNDSFPQPDPFAVWHPRSLPQAHGLVGVPQMCVQDERNSLRWQRNPNPGVSCGSVWSLSTSTESQPIPQYLL